MKKFLLVMFIGVVLVMNLYGIVNELMIDNIQEIDHISETSMIVYTE